MERYNIAVITDTMNSYNNWGNSKNYNRRRDCFTENEFDFIPITTPNRLRGEALDGIIELQSARRNPKYTEIMDIIDINFKHGQ